MSDMEEGFFSAWHKTMGPPSMRLFCTWHVQKAWRTNLNGKVTNKEKREEVKKMLFTLLYELDEDTFNVLLPKVIKRLADDEETKPFGEYFSKQYVGQEKSQVKCWAYCHRINSGINTNMSIENFNKVLKYCYLKGKKVKRLDKTLFAILNLIKDKLFDLIIKIEKGKLVRKLQCLRNRHKSSLSLDSEMITKLSDGIWQVLSSKNEEFYTIKKIQNCTNCQLVCTHCKSCFHQYNCSCIDNSIRNNMCKHIHLLCRSMCGVEDEVSVGLTENQEDLIIDVDCESANKMEFTLLDELSENMPVACSSSSLDEKKKALLEELKAMVEESIETEEELNLVKSHFKKLMPTLKAAKLASARPLQKSDNPGFPANSKIEKQRRFLSTRKKRGLNVKGPSKLTNEERQKIALDLLKDDQV
ncbi:uncharacterized protein LOC128998794 [Macrosteles quadrilineatus]|nr:uncharacterized protein LOC128998794 [Macrosteles quadrilineatus]